jgi:hypothetical protein
MIEVLSLNLRPFEGSAVRSAVFAAPEPGAVLPGYSVAIEGSATASQGMVEHIEILHEGVVVRRAPVQEVRGDPAGTLGRRTLGLVNQLLGASGLPAAGFRTRVSLLGLPLQSSLQVVATVAGERVELAELVLRRKPLRVSPPPRIHPLIVVTPGRAGSTWFSRLVGEHPAIVSHGPFESEPRVGSYWASVLRSLADPAGLVLSLAPKDMQGNWWLSSEDMPALPRVPDPDVEAWLVEEHPERTARFCLDSASDFYARVAAQQKKSDVVYYAEKFPPSWWVPDLLLELDAGAKDVFLVRDPRDQLASVVSWTAAGRGQFSTEATTTEDYIDWLALQTKLHLRHWQARSASSLLVRYEDLVLDPVPTLTRLFAYLGVDSTVETAATVLERALGAKQNMQRSHQTSGSPEQSIGRWRKDVSPDLWERMNEVFAPELEAWYGESRLQEASVGGSSG